MGKKYTYNAKLYRDDTWRRKRLEIYNRDNCTCQKCGKKLAINEFCVHHISYQKDIRPAEYDNSWLVTLCMGCHYKEHKHDLPNDNWLFVDTFDAGDYGDCECEKCGHQLKYVYTLFHKDIGFLDVGCDCADELLGTNEFSEHYKEQKKFNIFLKRFSPYMDKCGHRGEMIIYKRIFIAFLDNNLIQSFYGPPTISNRINLIYSQKYCSNITEKKVEIYNSIRNGKLDSFIHSDKNVYQGWSDKFFRDSIICDLGLHSFDDKCIFIK